MTLLLQLSVEFFSIGLFSVGGGMATVPFLSSIAERTGWVTLPELTSIIAISESTPRPNRCQYGNLCGLFYGRDPRRYHCRYFFDTLLFPHHFPFGPNHRKASL